MSHRDPHLNESQAAPNKDKKLSPSTVMQIHKRLSRLERSTADQQRKIRQLEQTEMTLDREIAAERDALLAARDDEAELVLRVIEAKLREQSLLDRRSTMEDHITQWKRDGQALQTDKRAKLRSLDKLMHVTQQKENEVVRTRRYARSCEARAKAIVASTKTISRATRELQENLSVRASVLQTNSVLLDSVKDTIVAAVEASSTGRLQETAT